MYRYVTEGSFDAYLWQTVERKAQFIDQLMRGRLDVREIEDIGDSALSYAEVKALASGDSRIMELAKAETDATKLERLERAWSAAQRSLAATIREAGPRLERLASDREQLLAAMPMRRDTDGDAFSIRINGAAYFKRADAAAALQRALLAVHPYQHDPQPLGDVGGLHLQASADSWLGQPRYVVSLIEVPRVHLLVEAGDVRQPSIGLVTRMENLPDAWSGCSRTSRWIPPRSTARPRRPRRAWSTPSRVPASLPRSGHSGTGSRPSWPPTAPRRAAGEHATEHDPSVPAANGSQPDTPTSRPGQPGQTGRRASGDPASASSRRPRPDERPRPPVAPGWSR